MNSAMGGGKKYVPWCDAMKKGSDLVKVPPSSAWVFVDQQPDSINDSMLYINPYTTNSTAAWDDIPASYHNGACGFCFADGHAEIKKWRDHRTLVPLKFGWFSRLPVPDSVDYNWIAERTPRK